MNGRRSRTLRSSVVPSHSSSESLNSPVSCQSCESESQADLAMKEGSMEDFLENSGCFESKHGLDHRREVLLSLSVLVQQWLQSQTLEQGYNWQYSNQVTGKIVTYGSYMLGISHQGADVDALFIAPSHISRESYFHSLYELFARQRQVTDLRAIEEAYVPVIKMKYDGIEIDMTFAKLHLSDIPPDLETFDNSMLKGLDQKCVRSLNGYRSTKEILNLVPNVDVFRLALRAVKLWAKSQGIYSNIMGYLGGFSWAVLVAKTCIMNPEIQEAEQMVHKFFQIFSKWNWPEPVMLRPLEDDSENPSDYSMRSWNPKKNPAERFHVMPIITPTYPHLNSTFNVTQSTLKLIQDKMNQAVSTCSQIFDGHKQWDSLFKTRHIFHEFEHFLFVIASAYKPLLWFGLIESKIRHFVINIERECPNLSGARIWPKPYTQVSDGKTIQLWFVGLHFQNSASLDLARPLQTFRDNLSRRARPFYTSDMCIYAELLHRAKVSAALSEADIHEIINSSQHRSHHCTPPQLSAQRSQLQQLSSSRSGTPSPASSCSALNSIREGGKGGGGSYAAAVSKAHHPMRHYYKMQGYPQTQRTFNTPPPISSSQSNGMMNSSAGNRGHHGGVLNNPYTNDVSPPIFERSWASSKTAPSHLVDVPSPPITPVSSLGANSSNAKTFVPSVAAQSTTAPPAVKARKCSDSETTSAFYNNSGADMSDTSYSSSIDETESCPRGSVSLSSDKFPPSGLVQARLHHTDTIPFSPAFASSPLWPISPTSPGNGAQHKSLFPSRSSGTPRLSSSEIRDVPSPLPVHAVAHHPIRFNFTSSALSSAVPAGPVTRVNPAMAGPNAIPSPKEAVFH